MENTNPPLHTLKTMPHTYLNHAFAAVYLCAILALFYHHTQTLCNSTSFLTSSISITLLISDAILTFMWFTIQSFRMSPSTRHEHLEKLEQAMKHQGFPDFNPLDVFICTADPFKEPPMTTVNTALSVMAYDYPSEKISVYVSDDGGSDLTLFALMEAAMFGRYWLPFCQEKNVLERSPEAYFKSNHTLCFQEKELKILYEKMKDMVESVVEKGKVPVEYVTTEQQREALNKWTNEFTRQDHPSVIQVILDKGKDKDVSGHPMPNLAYISREKRLGSPSHFKAGALNVLLRVSAVMSNAPIILTQDCDMVSNDPITPRRVHCYLSDSKILPNLGFIQLPQRFHNINKNDTYACEYKRITIISPTGMNCLAGPNYLGSGAFFRRRALFGTPFTLVSLKNRELSPDHVVHQPINSQQTLAVAHLMAACNYENPTEWGSKVGFRYGTVVEDYYTGFRMHCQGWRSIFCNPDRAAFLGEMPINLFDVLNQTRRWTMGLLDVTFSKYCPITFGTKSMGFLMALSYSSYAFWATLSFPITVYAFLPQLALLNGISIFPKFTDPWFFLYAFLFLGANAQDLAEFLLAGGTVQRWWNDQRMWMFRGLTCYLFGLVEFLAKSLGISKSGFNITSKVLDDQQSKRYHQGLFEFGVESVMFVPLAMAAIINLVAFVVGVVRVGRGGDIDVLGQVMVAGFVVVNCWPVYEGMVLRSDKGKMPTKISIISIVITFSFGVLFSLAVNIS